MLHRHIWQNMTANMNTENDIAVGTVSIWGTATTADGLYVKSYSATLQALSSGTPMLQEATMGSVSLLHQGTEQRRIYRSTMHEYR